MGPPRIVVVGAGLIGKRHIQEAMAQAQLCAIVDPSPAAAALARDLALPHFDELAGCLSQIRPDGVIIATPNRLHKDQALLCIGQGIPVLIEKPVADTLEAATAIETAAKAERVPVLVGHHRRHNPIVARARQVIEAGTLGQIAAVHGQFWLFKPEDYFNEGWRKAQGGGPAMINFIHDVDLLRHFCGDIAEIKAMRANVQRGHDVEDTAAIVMRFHSGALGSFTLSDTVVAPFSWEMSAAENPVYPHHPGACYLLGGTRASLSIPDLKLWRHQAAPSWWNPIEAETLEVTPADAFALQFSHFLKVIAGAAPKVSAADGRKSLGAVLEVLKAALPQQEEPR